jgi:HlyD family secretion protein
MGKSILKILIGIILVSILVFLGYQGYQQYLAPPPVTSTPETISEEQGIESKTISAEGKLVPQEYAQLSFKIPGLVKSIYVSEGDTIQAGEVIAVLEGREQLEATLATAQLELITAEQALDELVSLAPLQTAQAQQELAYARSALEDAERRWRNNQPGNRASIETIQATEEALAEAELVLEKAQEEYDQYSDSTEENAERLLAYSALLVARQVRDRIRSQLNWYKGIPSDTDQAILDSELALAESRVAEAERQWENLKDGPDKDQITLAQARVASANAQVAAAQTSLEDLSLRAPFSGTIITLKLKVGESISPTIPVVVLADISLWQVETIDLTENDIASIFPSMEAMVTLNAYPGQEFRAVVRKIGLLGEDRRGSVTYTVWLDLDPQDAKVQWGMTAFVDFHLR